MIILLIGDFVSTFLSLQHMSLEFVENVQVFSILKIIKFCDMSALKIQSGALCGFFKFTIFLAFPW